MYELQRSLSDRNIRIFQAVHDDGSVTLHRCRVELDHLAQRVERHVAYVVVAVGQEPVAFIRA